MFLEPIRGQFQVLWSTFLLFPKINEIRFPKYQSGRQKFRSYFKCVAIKLLNTLIFSALCFSTKIYSQTSIWYVITFFYIQVVKKVRKIYCFFSSELHVNGKGQEIYEDFCLVLKHSHKQRNIYKFLPYPLKSS